MKEIIENLEYIIAECDRSKMGFDLDVTKLKYDLTITVSEARAILAALRQTEGEAVECEHRLILDKRTRYVCSDCGKTIIGE